MGPIDCPETSVRNYHNLPCNNPEECSSHLLRGGSLKSRNLAGCRGGMKWWRQNNARPRQVVLHLSSPMSLASVHPIEMHNRDHSGLSNRSQSIGSSLEELHNCFTNSDAVLSIEELRLQLNSCFTCGVSWHEDHVSLDCRECGGYSLERPCPLCEGRCNSIWKRDLTMSHASGKARWEGECALRRQPEPNLIFKSLAAEEESLCSRLEKLGASS